MSALNAIKSSSQPPTEDIFRDARNVIMMRIFLANGQRTGALRNLTCGEYLDAIIRDTKNIIIVKTHKTSDCYVCELVLEDSLKHDLDTWYQARNKLLEHRLADSMCQRDNILFCDVNGKQLASNEPSRIARSGLGVPLLTCARRNITW